VDGLPAEDIREELDEIKRDGMLWHLQIDCLRYCRLVHMHHNAEDREFFPELRETNPELDPVIDRLQGDHRRVSDQLDTIEAAARALAKDGGQPVRRAVVDALHDLAENLLEHLNYEELSLEATVRRMNDLP
jgi:hemerythrin-like domain-containing protein